MLEGGAAIPTDSLRDLGAGVSRYAILGGIGYDLPAYSDLFGAGQGWAGRALRRGTPDANLSQVVVGSSQLAIRAGELGLAAAGDDDERAQIRAFSSGMICALAANIVVNPVLRDLQARRSPRDWDPRSPNGFAADLQRTISDTLLRGATQSGEWEQWWPEADELPDSLLQGYAEALEEVHRLGADRPTGFADFEAVFTGDGGPANDALDPDKLREAYRLFQNGDLRIGAGWNWFVWALVLAEFFLMPSFALAFGRLLPEGGKLLKEGDAPNEKSWYELLTLSLVMGSVTPFAMSMALWPSFLGNDRPFVESLIISIARFLFAILFGVSAADDWSPGVRWGLIFLPLLGSDIYALIRGLVDYDSQRPGPSIISFLHLLPLATLVTTLMIGSLIHFTGLKKDWQFWLIWALHTVGALVASGVVGNVISKAGGIPILFAGGRDGLPVLDSLGDGAATTGLRGLARLFDDSTLWHAPDSDAPRLDQLNYPAGRRLLVKLWWDGEVSLEVSHDGHKLTFRWDGAATQEVELPPTPLTAAGLAAMLSETVPDGASPSGTLHAVAADGDEHLYPLPYPKMLADPGDGAATLAEHRELSDDFLAVGDSEDEAYLLRHTPRVALTTPVGRRGVSMAPLEGLKIVPDGTLADAEGSALGVAGDLAALLCMGAAPSLNGGAVTVPGLSPPNDRLGPVYQVFRQWNLDERRINEWRMLVLGGAASEKAGAPAARDPAMRPNPDSAAPAYASSAPGGEPLSRAMGWTPLLRTWLRMAGDVTSDSDEAAPMTYTPAVRRGPGPSLPPTNRELSEAMRFLLDLP